MMVLAVVLGSVSTLSFIVFCFIVRLFFFCDECRF